MFKRIADLLGTIFGGWLNRAEGSVPIGERLAYDRQQRAQAFKRQMEKATDIGQIANLYTQQLATARTEVEALRDNARAHVQAAQWAKQRGDATAEEKALAAAADAAAELAEAQSDLTALETQAKSAMADKDEAYALVEQQARELQRRARGDARLVQRVYMTDMREQSLRLREEMIQLVPEDRENLRGRVESDIEGREARYQARRELVERLGQRANARVAAERAMANSRGRNILAELQAEVGYTPTQDAAMAAGVATPIAVEAPAPLRAVETAAPESPTGATPTGAARLG